MERTIRHERSYREERQLLSKAYQNRQQMQATNGHEQPVQYAITTNARYNNARHVDSSPTTIPMTTYTYQNDPSTSTTHMHLRREQQLVTERYQQTANGYHDQQQASRRRVPADFSDSSLEYNQVFLPSLWMLLLGSVFEVEMSDNSKFSPVRKKLSAQISFLTLSVAKVLKKREICQLSFFSNRQKLN